MPKASRRTRPHLPRNATGVIGAGLSLVFVAAGVAASLMDLQVLAIAATGIGAGIAAGSLITRLVAVELIDRPLEKIADSMETIAARDVLALVDEFASLAEGDPPRRLEVHAEPIELPNERTVRRVALAVNATIARLQAGAYQFYAASGEPCRRLFYVGADDYLLGCTAAEAIGGRLPEGGEVVLLSPHFRHAGVELRRRGFESTVLERFPNIEVSGVLASVFGTPAEAYRTASMLTTFMKTHPKLAAIYCTEAYGVLGAMDAFAGTPLAGKVVVVGHDLLDRSVAGLQSGLVSALITQDPFGQGHDTTIHLFNAIAHGWHPPDVRIITRSDIVTPENCHEYWRPYEGSVETAEMRDRRPHPLGPSKKRIRLAVLGIEDGAFWEPVRQGVDAASQELESCNATVEWLAPGGDFGFNMSTRAKTLERLTEEGYDGIATPIYDASLIPYLNRAVAAGIVVATLNSEASSLQGLVATLSKERRRLEIAAGTLETVAHHDALTGAYNRSVMDPDLQEAEQIANAARKQASIIMIDIDHFKAYNDTLGHTSGDEVLRMVAHRIQAEVRSGDRVYRYGGEEFLVLLRNTGIDEGQRVAAQICDGIASLGLPHDQNQPWGVVTVSAGVSALTGEGPSWSEVVAAANSALYRSKASGRNTVATAEPEPRGEGRFDSPGDGHPRINVRSHPR